uniref:Adenylate kinase n=1 Tax=Syphacia muris TaxID=451379 RepID=A0A0N5ABC4_9BILA
TASHDTINRTRRVPSVTKAAQVAKIPDVPIILFMGGPGGGKTKYAAKVRDTLEDEGLVHLCVPDMIRAAVDKYRDRYPAWREANEKYQKGELIANNLALELIKAEMGRNQSAKAFFLEGFPREARQVEDFEREIRPVDMALILDYDEATLRTHMENRGLDPDVIDQKIKNFKMKTLPSAKYFDEQHILHLIPGEADDQTICSLLKRLIRRSMETGIPISRSAVSSHRHSPRKSLASPTVLEAEIVARETGVLPESLSKEQSSRPSTDALRNIFVSFTDENKIIIPAAQLNSESAPKEADEVAAEPKRPSSDDNASQKDSQKVTSRASSKKSRTSETNAEVKPTSPEESNTGARAAELPAVEEKNSPEESLGTEENPQETSNAEEALDTNPTSHPEKENPEEKTGDLEADISPAALEPETEPDNEKETKAEDISSADDAAITGAAAAAVAVAVAVANDANPDSSTVKTSSRPTTSKSARSVKSNKSAASVSSRKSTSSRKKSSKTPDSSRKKEDETILAQNIDVAKVDSTAADTQPSEKKAVSAAAKSGEVFDEAESIIFVIGIYFWLFYFSGAPGSGKGEIAQRILKKFEGFDVYSMGKLLQNKIQHNLNDPQWSEIKKCMDQGKLIDDEVCRDVLFSKLEEQEENSSWGYVIEGYPRTTKQLEYFLEKFNRVDLALLIDCSEQFCKEAIKKRYEKSSSEGRRVDDSSSIVTTRLLNFKQNTLPMLDWFNDRNKLQVVEGDTNIDKIFSAVSNIIETTIFNDVRRGSNDADKQDVVNEKSAHAATTRDRASAQKVTTAAPPKSDVTNTNRSPVPPEVLDSTLKRMEDIQYHLNSHNSPLPQGLPNQSPCIIIIGPPGCVKSEIAKRIAMKYKEFKSFCMSELLTAKIEENAGDALWIKVNQFKDEGKIIIDEICREVLYPRIYETDKDCKGYVFEGYPRTVQQAQDFEKQFERVDMVLLLDCTEEYCRKNIADTYEKTGAKSMNFNFQSFASSSKVMISSISNKIRIFLQLGSMNVS